MSQKSMTCVVSKAIECLFAKIRIQNKNINIFGLCHSPKGHRTPFKSNLDSIIGDKVSMAPFISVDDFNMNQLNINSHSKKLLLTFLTNSFLPVINEITLPNPTTTQSRFLDHIWSNLKYRI